MEGNIVAFLEVFCQVPGKFKLGYLVCLCERSGKELAEYWVIKKAKKSVRQPRDEV